MVQAVIFDVDNTLYSYDRAHAPAFARLKEYAARELGIGPERFEQLHGQADRILRARLGQPCGALHNRLLRYQILLEEVGAPLEPHALAMTTPAPTARPLKKPTIMKMRFPEEETAARASLPRKFPTISESAAL